MRASLQGLITEVIGYGLGAVVNRFLGIIVACIYPILLTQAEYGRLDVIFSIEGLFVVVFYLGLDTALSRVYYETDDVVQRRRLVSTVFYSLMSFTVGSVIILLIFSKPLALWLYEDPRYISYFRLALISMPFAIANGVQLVVLRLERRIYAFNLIMAGNLSVAAIVGIGSILLFKYQAAGVLIGFIAGHLVLSIVGCILNRQALAVNPIPERLRELLHIGLPLVPSGVALWFIGQINRPILVHYVSARELGLYAIASGGAGMMALLLSAFRNAWQPFAFSIIGREGSTNVYGRALTLFTIAGAAMAATGSLFAPEGLLIINAYTQKNWSGAASSVGPLAMGTLFGIMYYIVQTGAFIVRRTGVIAMTMGTAAASSVLFNFMLIPPLGILGAAFATALGQLTALTIMYIVSQRLAPIPYQPGKLMTTILASAAVILAGSYLQTHLLWRDLLLKLALLAAYFVTLLATRTLAGRDIAVFWKLIFSLLKKRQSNA